jgi:patatin-like phospholipase/acyl hydrolase
MYNRNPMEDFLWEEVYGDLMITDALTELTVVSYSMEAQEARMYSKYMAATNPEIYDMRLFDAACATSAAPAYWQLKCTPTPCRENGELVIFDNENENIKQRVCKPQERDNTCEHLIDGGVVQNNPSTYAMSIAMMISDARKKAGLNEPIRPIRLISIGTGGSPIFDRIKQVEGEQMEFSMVDWFTQFSYISMTVPQMHATFESSTLADNFLRVDLHSPSDMADKTAVDSLINQGRLLAIEFSDKLDEVARILIKESKDKPDRLY